MDISVKQVTSWLVITGRPSSELGKKVFVKPLYLLI